MTACHVLRNSQSHSHWQQWVTVFNLITPTFHVWISSARARYLVAQPQFRLRLKWRSRFTVSFTKRLMILRVRTYRLADWPILPNGNHSSVSKLGTSLPFYFFRIWVIPEQDWSGCSGAEALAQCDHVVEKGPITPSYGSNYSKRECILIFLCHC